MRCSALPLASKCRGSWRLTGNYGSVMSRVGQAFHEAARAKVLGQKPDIESIRTRYALTDLEVKDIDYGLYNIQIRIPEGAMVVADDKEMSALGGKLTGTMDLGIYWKLNATIVDWKSGWGDVEDPETNNQLLGYGVGFLEALEAQNLPVDKIILMVIQPRLNQVKTAIFTPAQIRARAKDIEQIIAEAEAEGAEFTTGPWCASCFKNMNCPAFAGQVQSLARYLAPGAAEVGIEADLRRLLPLAKAVGPVAAKIEALAKAWVDQFGPLELGDGQTYVKTVGEKQEIDTAKAMKVLPTFFDQDQIYRIMKISSSDLNDLCVATKRGLSTVVKNNLIAEGAITKKTSITYKLVKEKIHEREGQRISASAAKGKEERAD